MKQLVAILGATGSIGQSTLKILEQHAENYQLYAASGFHRMSELVDICLRFAPQVVALPKAQAQQFLRLAEQKQLRQLPQLVFDEAGLVQIAAAAEVDVVMAAIVGAAGLQATLAALHAGKRVLLANKEALVMAGDIMLAAAKQHQALLLPVDSEHNAIFQCLPSDYFAHRQTAEQLSQVTPAQACKHPNWSMGQKISVDSATLMNKGLELIEACHLFAISEQFVTVVIHPQSIVHSMVQYIDGSTLAQMGNPDMCTPIAHALAWPTRIQTQVPALNLFDVQKLDFSAPDPRQFPALPLARQAIRAGGTAPAILNAANEVAVAAFLANRVRFLDIMDIVAESLAQLEIAAADDLAVILQADQLARQCAQQWINQYGVQ
jgi:1-deoxy-D-xylulose-5-phosphate reductoisomerase